MTSCRGSSSLLSWCSAGVFTAIPLTHRAGRGAQRVAGAPGSGKKRGQNHSGRQRRGERERFLSDCLRTGEGGSERGIPQSLLSAPPDFWNSTAGCGYPCFCRGRPGRGSLSPAGTPPSEENAQEFLLRLRESRLKDDALLEEYYDKIIESYLTRFSYFFLRPHNSRRCG